MAVEIGLTGYCTARPCASAHRRPQRLHAPDTEPTLAEVEQFIKERFDRINAELDAEGYTTPFGTARQHQHPPADKRRRGSLRRPRIPRRPTREQGGQAKNSSTALQRIKDGDNRPDRGIDRQRPLGDRRRLFVQLCRPRQRTRPRRHRSHSSTMPNAEIPHRLCPANSTTTQDTGILTVTHYLGPTETYKVIRAEPPPAQQPLRYWGWADDTNITDPGELAHRQHVRGRQRPGCPRRDSKTDISFLPFQKDQRFPRPHLFKQQRRDASHLLPAARPNRCKTPTASLTSSASAAANCRPTWQDNP